MKNHILSPIKITLLVLISSCATSDQENQDYEEQDSNDVVSDSSQDIVVDPGFIPLFNGENLDGWDVKAVKEDQHLDFWSVQDGAIVVNSIGIKDHDYSWLMTTQEFSDFELRLKFKSFRDSPGNSGVQIRSRYDSKGTLEGSEVVGWLDGPQVDVHPSDPWRTGFIYDETRGHQRWIYPDLPDWNIDKSTYAPKEFRHFYADEAPFWNELVIICKGNQITTRVNGITVADYDGTGVLDDSWHQKYGVDKSGFIALQLHKDDELKMEYKDILIKEL